MAGQGRSIKLSSPGLDRAIQYSRGALVVPRGGGVLDHPRARVMKVRARVMIVD
jgi:hypothetical protein